MTLAQETQVLFILSLIMGAGLIIYLAVAGMRLREDDKLYQMTANWLLRRINKDYDGSYRELLDNLSKDWTRAYAYPVRRMAQLSKKWFKANPRTTIKLNGVEQAKVMTWLLNFEQYPENWKVAKIRTNRSLDEIIRLAAELRGRNVNDVIAALV